MNNFTITDYEKRSSSLKEHLRPWIPFTALNTIYRKIGIDVKTILDVGCGVGVPIRFINRKKKYYTVGLDIFEPYIASCKRRGIHDKYILGNILELNIEEDSYDLVLCTEVLEHLPQNEGKALLSRLEKIAKKQIIISTPVGHYKQKVFDGNIYQEHKSEWQPAQMRNYGYQVIGIGLRNFGGKSGVQSPLPKLLHPIIDLLWVLAGPIVYFYPKIAGDMVCIKKISK